MYWPVNVEIKLFKLNSPDRNLLPLDHHPPLAYHPGYPSHPHQQHPSVQTNNLKELYKKFE